jgi:hypothetical protein
MSTDEKEAKRMKRVREEKKETENCLLLLFTQYTLALQGRTQIQGFDGMKQFVIIVRVICNHPFMKCKLFRSSY